MWAEGRPFTITNTDPRGEEWRYADADGFLDFGRGYCGPPPDVLYVTEISSLVEGSPVSPERLLQVLVRIQQKFDGTDLCVHRTSAAIPLLRKIEDDGWLSVAPARERHEDWCLIRLGRRPSGQPT